MAGRPVRPAAWARKWPGRGTQAVDHWGDFRGDPGDLMLDAAALHRQ
jgi:hypothetical protein